MKGFEMTLKISGSGFRIPDEHREWYNAVLDDCRKKRGGWATVRVTMPRRSRSTGNKSQNHHLNGHIQQISTITGQPFGSIKEEVKMDAIDRGYPILYNAKGEVVKDKYGRAFGISESDASVEECALLIEQVHQLAAELDIVLMEGE